MSGDDGPLRLDQSAAAIVFFAINDGNGNIKDGTPAWAGWLAGSLFVLAIVGALALRRAGDAYPPGKHADPNGPPERRRLFDRPRGWP